MTTFNSRYLTYKQVSDQFILTQNFKQLTKPCHTILLGSRGSGKTTMLKMLQPEAMKFFANADYTVPFYGVYIPSDRQWSFILEKLGEENNVFLTNVSRALVNINVLLAFLETLNFVITDKSIDESDSYNFCSQLVKNWKLGEGTPPLIDTIRLQLRNYAIELQNAVNETQFDYVIPFICKTHFIDSLSLSLDIVESAFKKYSLYKQWALCFDEMELTPEWLQTTIVNVYLRSRDQRILFKLTSTPDWVISQNSYMDAAPHHDIEIIKCWDTTLNGADWKHFCDTAIQNHILKKYSIYLDELKDLISPTRVDRSFYLKNLPKVDDGFAKFFLHDYDLDENNQVTISRTSSRSKYYEFVVLSIRYYYYCKKKDKPCSIGDFYLGDWLLYKMADGNPRTLFHILNEVSHVMSVNGKLQKNIPGLFNAIISYSTSVFDEQFAFCAMEPLLWNDSILGFRDILTMIGNFFTNEVLGEKYKPQPRTMFSIDDDNHYDQFGRFLHVGLESGAIIQVSDRSAYSGRHIKGVFRLSYILFPRFFCAPSTSREVVYISEILNRLQDDTK